MKCTEDITYGFMIPLSCWKQATHIGVSRDNFFVWLYCSAHLYTSNFFMEGYKTPFFEKYGYGWWYHEGLLVRAKIMREEGCSETLDMDTLEPGFSPIVELELAMLTV